MEEMKKRFDEKFGYEISEMRKEYKSYLSKPEDITFFIQSEIDLAVSKERERINQYINENNRRNPNPLWAWVDATDLARFINTK